MNQVVIIGGGFAGLCSAYRLLCRGHAVTIIEKGREVGGLASPFKIPKWGWALEKYYHHWFTNDYAVLNLAKEIDHKVMIKKPRTDLFYKDHIHPFDSPLAILSFPFFSLLDKFRLSLSLLYLKASNDYHKFENTSALFWIDKYMGKAARRIVWEPLFKGKFGEHKDSVLLTWFWARIKKRTPRLVYPIGGFASFTERLVKKIKKMGGKIVLGDGVNKINRTRNGFVIQTVKGAKLQADKILVTTPSSLLPKLFPNLPSSYKKTLEATQYLSAQVLVLRLKKQFMDHTYWLSMSDPASPFLAVVEHTNFINTRHYNGEHIVYVGNYLDPRHPYLAMNAKELLNVFDPQLAKINKGYKREIIEMHLFSVSGAQPIVDKGYAKRIPKMITPIKGIYLSNMEMVYPWDRGTNYAVEYGEKVAELISKDFSEIQ